MLIAACWGLGLISILTGVLLKLSPALELKFNLKAHMALLGAIVLFLCSLATAEMERLASKSS
jgi:hypothetical protein